MTVDEGDKKALHRGVGEGATPFPGLLHFILDTYLILLSVNQQVTSTIFKVFGMTRPGIEPRFSEPLANTLPTRPKRIRPNYAWLECFMLHSEKYIQICLEENKYLKKCSWVQQIFLMRGILFPVCCESKVFQEKSYSNIVCDRNLSNDWAIDFNSISICQRLFNAKRLMNRVHCIFLCCCFFSVFCR